MRDHEPTHEWRIAQTHKVDLSLNEVSDKKLGFPRTGSLNLGDKIYIRDTHGNPVECVVEGVGETTIGKPTIGIIINSHVLELYLVDALAEDQEIRDEQLTFYIDQLISRESSHDVLKSVIMPQLMDLLGKIKSEPSPGKPQRVVLQTWDKKTDRGHLDGKLYKELDGSYTLEYLLTE